MTIEDDKKLAANLTLISKWAEKLKLRISIQKSFVLCVSRFNHDLNYSISDILLKQITECSDLAVLFDQRLPFKTHCQKIIQKAKRLIYLLFNVFIQKIKFSCKGLLDISQTHFGVLFSGLVTIGYWSC